MRERPILFSDPMVRAILSGSKTQTRRVVKPQPRHAQALRDGRFESSADGGFDRDVREPRCPYGAPGDRLWVRECWGLMSYLDPTAWHGASVRGADDRILGHWKLEYRADWGTHQESCRWRPSIHMPRWASRLTLEVKSVRVERLQAITEEDARSEGVAPAYTIGATSPTYREGFEVLWNELLGVEPKGHAESMGRTRKTHEHEWDANPWVWVVGFERAESTKGRR